MTRIYCFCLCLSFLGACATSEVATSESTPAEAAQPAAAQPTPRNGTMELGAFSVSLAVKDLATSRDFYQKLGFEASGGSMEHNYLIMKNGSSIVGLFQGMFEKNILTFNPGWDQNAQALASFTDVRDLQAKLVEQGVEFQVQADAKTDGPASFVLVDPDGNPVLIDQHVPRPSQQ